MFRYTLWRVPMFRSLLSLNGWNNLWIIFYSTPEARLGLLSIDRKALGYSMVSPRKIDVDSTEMWHLKGSFREGKKYGRGTHLTLKSAKSPLLDSIASHDQVLRTIGFWIVGCGDVSLWDSNWLGTILQGPLPCDIKLTVCEGFFFL